MPATPEEYAAFTERFRLLTATETNVKVADRVGCSAGWISQFKSGKKRPTQRLLLLICAAYGLDIHEWMTYAGYNNHPLRSRGHDAIPLPVDQASARCALLLFAEGIRVLGL